MSQTSHSEKQEKTLEMSISNLVFSAPFLLYLLSFQTFYSLASSLASTLPMGTPPSRVIVAFCDRHPNSNMSNWLESYDPATNSWQRVGPVPGVLPNHLLKGFSMVSIGESVYIIGGRLCRKEDGGDYENDLNHDPDDIVDVAIDILPTVARYNARTNEWSTCAPLGTPRFDFACTVSEGRIYVAGGQCGLGGAKGISSAEVYDSKLDTWWSLPDMNTVRYKCVGVTWQEKIHVVGGFSDISSNIYSPARSSAEVLNVVGPRSGKWDQVGMWQLDVPPNQIVPVNGKLFSSGDCLNAWKGHIEAYDGKLNIWNVVDGSHLQNLSSPRSTNCDADQRLYLTMAPIGNELYFLAGYRMCGEVVRSMSVVHRFDTVAPCGGQWRSFEPMEEEGDKELCSHCCVVQV